MRMPGFACFEKMSETLQSESVKGAYAARTGGCLPVCPALQFGTFATQAAAQHLQLVS